MDVVIITLNEERNIVACVSSASLAHRVIVVDSGSSDRTAELARGAGAEVVVHPFKDFADQRNFALSVATTEWVLQLDADERMTPELWSELTAAVDRGGFAGFRIPTQNYFVGKPLRHGGWYPQYHLRLQMRTRTRWTREVHEFAVVDGAVGVLRAPMLHFGHVDLTSVMNKVNKYTSVDARQLGDARALLCLRALVEPPAYFLFKFVVQLGFLDGWRGLAAAAILSFYRCAVYLKALEHTADSEVQ